MSDIIYNSISICGLELKGDDIISLEMYESIEEFGIIGFAIIRDFNSLRAIIDITVGDPFKVNFFRTDDIESANKPFDHIGLITDFKEIQPESTSEQESTYIQIEFVSFWLYEAMAKSFPRFMVDQKDQYLENIVKTLLTECEAPSGGMLGIDGLYKIEKTQNFYDRYSTPQSSLLGIIERYKKIAFSDRNSQIDGAEPLTTDGEKTIDFGGYYCFYDRIENTMRFQSHNSLLKEKHELFIGYNSNILRTNTSDEESINRIHNISLVSHVDFLRTIDRGVPNTINYAFNYDTGQLKTDRDNIVTKNKNALSLFLPISDILLNQKYARHQKFNLSMNTDKLQKKFSAFEGMVDSLYFSGVKNIIEILVTVHGETMRRQPGLIQQIEYPTINTQGDIVNEALSGYFLIKSIRHSIKNRQYFQTLSLVSDGVNTTKRSEDFVTWAEKVGVPPEEKEINPENTLFNFSGWDN